MFAEPEFWVAVAFVILMGVFAYVGVHRTVLKTLDHRSDRIKAELDDARRLKDEAAKLLAEYKARHATAEREAEDIIAAAKAEAERIATEAKAKMEDFVARRTKTAEGKIALAEAQALADVRAAAADAAVTAASTHPVAVGQGRGRRRPAGQGHRRSSRKAELTPRHAPPPGLAFGEPDDRLRRGIQHAAASRIHPARLRLRNRPVRPGDDRKLLLALDRLRLRRQGLRIEADIEDVGIAGRSLRHRIDQIFRHQAERHAAGIVHRHRCPVDLGGDGFLLHAALHHGDTQAESRPSPGCRPGRQ